MAKLLAGVLVLTLSSTAYANTISFTVGVPLEMTLVVGLPTYIPAAIINTGDAPIDFGCAYVSCGGLQAFTAGFSGIPLSGGASGIAAYRDQFIGVYLEPNERFDFYAGLPATFLGGNTLLTYSFDITDGVNTWETTTFFATVTAGAQTAFSALTFQGRRPVPDHGSAWWIAGALLLAHGILPRRRAGPDAT